MSQNIVVGTEAQAVKAEPIAQAQSIVQAESIATIQEKVQYSIQQCDVLFTMQRSLITNHMGIQDDLADTKAFSPNDKATIESLERLMLTSEKGLADYRVTIADHCN